ncbi:glycoside hydrolase family 88 protein [Paenibacillus silviterrae]|uniref:glycoside hydrolase family 88 protein n=1 Tax=Paenibacillus silviterrae TaxID=3242194 RepID=UPI002543B82C|nr:glycoside hydrolase family 88 protein [Paenibacillus chinjuensis]
MDAFRNEVNTIIHKINKQMDIYGTRFPHLSASGLYSNELTEDGSWTGSFWSGMVCLAYWYTKEDKYLQYLYRYYPVYKQRLQEGYKDHDLGFLYQLYAVALYNASKHEEARALAIQAAEELTKRYNSKGRFIRAWGPLEEPELAGKMIMDCMMNLPLLYSATKLTGDPTYLTIADHHASSTYLYNIRSDYSTYHTFDFHPETGEPLGGSNEGGYSDESAWSRGQAWGIYGFALAFRHTGQKKYLKAACRMADYFMSQLNDDLIPNWDFKLPDSNHALKDTSAAAITACGMLEIAELLEDGSLASESYRYDAIRILEKLRTSYSQAGNDRLEGILSHCYAKGDHHYTIWGDYYYLEGILRVLGVPAPMWTA